MKKAMMQDDLVARNPKYRMNSTGNFLWWFLVFAICTLVMLGLIYTASCTIKSVRAEGLQPEDLEYRGAFQVPPWRPGPERFGYGMTSIAYNPKRKTLFASGHPSGDLVGEITIPTPSIEEPYQRALLVQPFGDVAGAFRSRFASKVLDSFGGLAVIDDHLYWSFFRYYAVQPLDRIDDATFGRSSLDLAAPNAEGMWKVGPYGTVSFSQKMTSRYILEIPKHWADAHVGGKRLGVGKGDGPGNASVSHGPCLIATAIPAAEVDGAPLDATILIQYLPSTGDHFERWSPCDRWTGAAWIDGDRSAVLFSGRRGRGTTDYGTPAEVSERQGRETCGTGKGYHCDPYEAEVVFYSPDDLALVAAGTVMPFEIKPYARMTLPMERRCSRMIGGMTYNAEAGEVYIVEDDGENPVVHVWKIKEGGPVTDPNDTVNTLMDTKLEVLTTQIAILMVEGASIDDVNTVVSLAKIRADEWKEGDKVKSADEEGQ